MWRLLGALAVVTAAAVVAAYIWAVLFVTPVNVDETQRLARTADLVLEQQAPRADLWPSDNPAFVLLLYPLVAVLPPHALPLAMRVLALALMLLGLAVYYFVLRAFDRENAWLAFLASLTLVFSCPALLFKATEARPDAPAAACVLLGLLAVFRSRRAAGRLVGWILLGVAVALRLEAVLVLAPVAVVEVWRIRRKEIRAGWLLALGIPPLVTLLTHVLLYRDMVWRILADWPLVYTVITKTVAPYSLSVISSTLLLPGLIGLVGVLGRVWRLRSAGGKDEGPFNAALLGAALLLFVYHTFGIRLIYLQTFWGQFYLLAPFAGLAAVKGMRAAGWLRRDGLFHRAFPLIAALIALNAMLYGIPRQYRFREYVPQPRQETAPTPAVDLSPDNLIFVAYSTPQVARFWRWLEERYGRRFTAYADDVVLPFGDPVVRPRHIMDAVVAIPSVLRREYRDQRAVAAYFARFPDLNFVWRGKAYTPGGFLAAKAPDVLMADHLLSRLCREAPELRRLLREKYRFVMAGGEAPVYVRRSSP
jgi:hypothetical protein